VASIVVEPKGPGKRVAPGPARCYLRTVHARMGTAMSKPERESIQPSIEAIERPEVGLDPANWEEFERLGQRMVSDMMAFLEHIGNEPAWQPMPEASRDFLRAPAPHGPADADTIYREFREHILPYRLGNVHPRFWARVMGTGTPMGMLASMLTAGMNSNASGLECADAHVEAQVLSWWKQLLRMPETTSGILLSGASAANLVCLNVARDVAAGGSVVEEGLGDAAGRLRVYVTLETHNCVRRAMALLGLGNRGLHFVETDGRQRMRVDALAAALREDREAGLLPMAVVATAGSVMTGAIDPLDEIAAVCQEMGVWLHVDGAYGAMLAISPRLAPRLSGLERADSLAFDLHKWMSMPYGVGCALIRDAAAHLRSFDSDAAYLRQYEKGTTAAAWAFHKLGPELSRGFRGLPVWMTMRQFGVDHFARIVEQNIEQAGYLAEGVRGRPQLELLHKPELNVVCFRYLRPGLDEDALDRLNGEILVALQEEGTAVPNPALVDGRSGLRCAIVNHRTRRADLDRLLEEVLRLGDQSSEG